jgi:diacylglycerol kinase (CTP)
MTSIGYTLKRKVRASRVTTRSEIQVFRKLYHMLCGLLISFLYLHLVQSQTVALLILGIIGGVIISAEYLRLHIKSLNKFFLKYAAPITRREEVHSFSSMGSFIISSFIAILVFPPAIASLAILLLALSDPAASIIGIIFGKEKFYNGKSLQGSLACFVVAFGINKLYINRFFRCTCNLYCRVFIY